MCTVDPRRHRGVLTVGAIMMACVPAVAVRAQDVFDDDGGTGGGVFNAAGNWQTGLPVTFPDLDGNFVEFDVVGPLDIIVDDDIVGLEGLRYLGAATDLTFVGTGSFTFDNAAVAFLNPDSGSFTFDIDVTSLINMDFNLLNGGSLVFQQNATFDGDVTTFNGAGSLIHAAGGDVTFNGAVNTDAGGNWRTSLDGSMVFNGAFNATGDQLFEVFSSGGMTFNDAVTFDGGLITVNGDAAAVGQQFNAVFNDTFTLLNNAQMIAANSGFFVFRDEFNFSSTVSFLGDGTGGGFVFEDFATALVLDNVNNFSVSNTSIDFQRAVELNGGDVLTVENSGSVTFGQNVVSAADTNFTVETGGELEFLGEFSATGNQNFGTSGGGVAGGTVLFGQQASFDSGGAAATATFNSITANFASMLLGDDYDLFIDGTDNRTQVTVGGDVDFAGSHEIDLTGDAGFTVGGNATFAAGQILNVLNDTGNSEVNFNGNMTFAGDMELTFDSGSLGTDTLDAVLGGAGSTISAGGNLTLSQLLGGNAGTSTIDLSATIDVVDGVDDFTFTVDLGTNDTVNVRNSAFANVSGGTLDINSGTVHMFGENVTSEDNPMDLIMGADGVLRLQPNTQTSTFYFNQLTSSGVGGTITAFGSGDPDQRAELLIMGDSNYSGVISDGDPGSDASLLLSLRGSNFEYTGNASYSGATQVREGSVLQLGNEAGDRGEIIGTTRVGAFITSPDAQSNEIHIVNGQLSTAIGTGSTQDGAFVLESNAKLYLFNPDGPDVSGLFVAGDLNVLGSGSLLEMETGTRVVVDGDTQVLGTLNLSGDAVTPVGEFDLVLGDDIDDNLVLRGQMNLGDSSRSSISGTSTIFQNGQLLLTEDAVLEHGGELTLNGLSGSGMTLSDNAVATIGTDAATENALQINAGEFRLENSAKVTVGTGVDQTVTVDGGSLVIAGDNDVDQARFNALGAMTFGGSGILDMSGESILDAREGITFSSLGSVVDGSGSQILGGPITIADGGGLQFTSADAALASLATVDLGGDNVTVESGGNLFGNVNFLDIGNLDNSGTVMVGANADTVGRMNITNGSYVSGATGDLLLGFSWDAAAILGDSSMLTVQNGSIDFSGGGGITLGVSGTDYISTESTFTLLEAPTAADLIDIPVPESAQASVTRRWMEVDNGPGSSIYQVTRSANYLGYADPSDPTSTAVCLTGELAPIGNMLNSLIPYANADPTSAAGQLLGSFDAIQDCPSYEAAVLGIEPTAQSSVIMMATRTQYYDVLRNEIRRETIGSDVAPPGPFRLEDTNPASLFMQADDQAVAAQVRRTGQPHTDYITFGRAYGRSLKLPTKGNVIGFDGNEYGGLGGFGFDIQEGLVVGVDLGYSAFSGNLLDGYGNERVSTLRGGPYVSYRNDAGWFLDAAFNAGWNRFDYTRTNTALPGAGSVNGTGNGFQLDLSLGGGYPIELGEGFSLTPEASFLYSYLNTGEFSETKAVAGSLPTLTVTPGDTNSIVGRAGANLAFLALPGLVFDVEAGWQGNFTITDNYSAGPVGVPVALPLLPIEDTVFNTAYYGAGVSWLVNWSVALNFRYSGRVGDGVTSNMISGGLSIRF